MIEIKGLYKSFGDNSVLEDINAAFEPGNVNMIIGASGSGKSVMMKTLVGLIRPDKGEIFYDGEDFLTMDIPNRKKLCQKIGMLFQASALFDSLNTEENVAFPMKIFTRDSKKEIAKRVDFCLERVGLEKANKLLPSELSGGMKKRVGIARAIVMNPKFLFCDEPNSGLDPKTAIVINKLIKDLTVEFNATTVINSHDMNSLFEIGDFMIYIHNRTKWWQGNPNEIKKSGNKELVDFVYASRFMQEEH